MTSVAKLSAIELSGMGDLNDVRIETITYMTDRRILKLSGESAGVYLDKAGTEALIEFAQEHLEKLS